MAPGAQEGCLAQIRDARAPAVCHCVEAVVRLVVLSKGLFASQVRFAWSRATTSNLRVAANARMNISEVLVLPIVGPGFALGFLKSCPGANHLPAIPFPLTAWHPCGTSWLARRHWDAQAPVRLDRPCFRRSPPDGRHSPTGSSR